jgi:phosphoribosylanthranilate isomerase
MNFITRIKLNAINNLADARFAAAAGIDYLGFCLDPSADGYVPAMKVKEMMGWLSGGYCVGEFGEQPVAEIEAVSSLLGLDAVEAGGACLPSELKTIGLPIIRRIDVSKFDAAQLRKELEAFSEVADVFHLVASASVIPSPEELFPLLAAHRILWGLPLTNDEVTGFIGEHKPFGISVNGGDEERAGVRDFADLNDLLDRLTV